MVTAAATQGHKAINEVDDIGTRHQIINELLRDAFAQVFVPALAFKYQCIINLTFYVTTQLTPEIRHFYFKK